ncbi:MAG: coproporphyrinogen III oxidase, partial [Mariprofundales bacterium]|nr:coproporphyrinogen III oxidase [Mariprofundales bacterium]
LQSWVELLPPPQNSLLQSLIAALPDNDPAPIGNSTKIELANRVRNHYSRHPEAITMQATSTITPPTVQNHE